jgi:hypothetical protein
MVGTDEVARLTAALGQAVRTRAGARHLMAQPAIAALAHDARLLGLAGSVLGPRPRPFRATLFDKSREANWLVVWHQDTALPLRERRDMPGWGPWSVKAGRTYAHAPAAALERIVALRLHLDDSTADNGPLRVLPGSHTRGVLSDESIRSLVARGVPHDCLVGRGGILVMRPLLVHASSKAAGDAPRRVVHIEYTDGTPLEANLELALA